MILEAFFLLGAIHGFILALILSQKKVNRLPNKLLALLMIVFSIDLGMAAFHSFGLHTAYPDFIGIDYPITLLYGPLLYLYVKTMKDGCSTIKRYDYLHFVPFIILLIYMIPFYTGTSTAKLAFITSPQELSHTFGFGFINHLKVLHGLTYAGCLIFMLLSYRKKLKDSFSSIEKVNLNWLQNFVIASIVLAAIAGGIHFTNFSNTTLMGLGESVYSNITLLSVTIFVYGIGYMGLYQAEVFTESKPAENSNHTPQEQYQKSGLTQEEAERYAKEIRKVMEEQKLYQDSDLKLADLAKEFSISSHNLTEILNQYMGQNFYDFVNHYRVKEVKQKLKDPGSKNKTLLALALDAGFNSKSSFNSVFKKQTGMTPSQFRKNHSIPG
ncbi:helix-turn-helix domain-containing protein [Aliifodinibius salicampi]|uniref:Helix-turn-helix domain-containing protein n=1 Tax=Fodinibius salicampi TaxID=1920655 RepID=A0ABT3PWT3_9BACT|nr:helix-turn-helix domain-containing protein [Fodinibius salicampi]MCW9712319.1 helix-turn-helix domain-containing protein [Fodinibius salicampi]